MHAVNVCKSIRNILKDLPIRVLMCTLILLNTERVTATEIPDTFSFGFNACARAYVCVYFYVPR